MTTKADARLARVFLRSKRKMPWAAKAIDWVSEPSRHFVRLPIAVLFILGTALSFLPGFGIWMLPVGLVLLSVDLPTVRPFTTAFVIRAERFLTKCWRGVRNYFTDEV